MKRIMQLMLIISIFLHVEACTDTIPNRLPESSLTMLDGKTPMTIAERATDYDMGDAKGRAILKEGQIDDGDAVRTDAGKLVIELPFATVRDRLLRFRLKSPEPVQISARLDGQALPALAPVVDSDSITVDLACPASMTRPGINRIEVEFTPHTACRIERISALDGGARLGWAAVWEDIRHAVIGYPFVTVSFRSTFGKERNVLAFSTGLDDYAQVQKSDGGRVRMIVRAGTLEQVGDWIPVRPGEKWAEHGVEIDRGFAGKECEIAFEFDAGEKGDPTGDLLALADVRVVGEDVPKGPPGRPSIILITMDSCRIDRLGFGGDDIILCPALDHLARRGNVFSDCICQINNTPPSHYTILTSKRPHTHGVYDMVTPLSDRHPTVARLLAPEGYRCAAATSAAWLSARTHGLGPGFERFYAPGEAQRRAPVTYRTIAGWLRERAQASASQPFFTWLHFFDPHTPFDPPKPYDAMYYAGNPRDPANHSMDTVGFSPEQVEYMKSWIGDITDIDYIKAQYRSEITYMDATIEKLMRMLAETGADRNTWLVITADHGISLDEHNLYFIMAGMYEQQMHIPLLVVPPGEQKAGRVFGQTVQSLDIAPTIMSIAGEAIPSDFEGRNLLPLLSGESIPAIPHVISEHANNQAVMLREPEYKYVHYFGQPYYMEPEVGLYHLPGDPMEMMNLIGTQPEKEADMSNRVGEFYAKPIGEADTGAAHSDALQKKLEALGYIEPGGHEK